MVTQFFIRSYKQSQVCSLMPLCYLTPLTTPHHCVFSLSPSRKSSKCFKAHPCLCFHNALFWVQTDDYPGMVFEVNMGGVKHGPCGSPLCESSNGCHLCCVYLCKDRGVDVTDSFKPFCCGVMIMFREEQYCYSHKTEKGSPQIQNWSQSFNDKMNLDKRQSIYFV